MSFECVRPQGVWGRLADELDSFPERIRDIPVSPRVTSAELRAELDSRYRLSEPVPLEELVADVARLLRDGTVHVTHPRYFGLFNPSVRPAAITGDVLAALYNPQLAVWSHAPAANELERLVLRRLATVLGLDAGAVTANFTTGGLEANLSAVVAALAHRYPDWSRHGIAALARRPAIYLGEEGHHSFVKIARMTGLGTDAVRTVPVSRDYAIDPDALADRMDVDAATGWEPLMVVGTAGTTTTGAVDPLRELAALAAARGGWFHVDAAWGGLAALVPRLRRLLDGIETADSITWDAHKGLSVPMGAGMFFSRHPDAVRHAFAVSASYMPSTADAIDPYESTVQWSRRTIGLKVFMALAEVGLAGYQRLIDHQVRIGELLRSRLSELGWEIVNRTELPLVCVTHPDIRAGRRSAAELVRAVQQRGRAWISEVSLPGGGSAVRACVTSYHSDQEDVEVLCEELQRARLTDAGTGAEPHRG